MIAWKRGADGKDRPGVQCALPWFSRDFFPGYGQISAGGAGGNPATCKKETMQSCNGPTMFAASPTDRTLKHQSPRMSAVSGISPQFLSQPFCPVAKGKVLTASAEQREKVRSNFGCAAGMNPRIVAHFGSPRIQCTKMLTNGKLQYSGSRKQARCPTGSSLVESPSTKGGTPDTLACVVYGPVGTVPSLGSVDLNAHPERA
jgi:hypothetical protein